MKWILLLAVVALVVFVLKQRAAATLPATALQQHLSQGALLVDVRTPDEYRSGHLPGSVNIPLDRVREELPRRLPDKSHPVLLHCRSGRRSAMAEQQLRALGYTNVFNIGSYGQAERLLRSRGLEHSGS